MIRKKTALILGFITAVVTYVVLYSSSSFLGRLVFFEDAPVRDQVVEGNFVKRQEAADLLISAAQQSGRINAEEAAAFRREFQKGSNRKITRREFAEMAVKVFGIEKYGAGPQLSDINSSLPNARAIYLFVSQGGVSFDFKPDNPATRAFAENAAANLRTVMSNK